MKTTIRFFLLFCFFLPLTNTYSQSMLTGVITDSLSKEYLIGANVYLPGTAFGGVADINGKFRIMNIPDGSYTVRVSYIGYATKFIPVSFSNKIDVNLTVLLQSEGVVGEEVVITAQRKGQVAAINQQISSQVMVNVVSADRIKELPDANAAEAVGRLPGISLIRSAGEASKIVIRGLEPKMNAITVNGIKIPSTSTTDRSVDLSMVSSESLEGIEVFKATTPDMDAEAVGGVVNLKIKKAPEEQKMQLKLSPGYNQLANSFGDYKVTGEYSDRFFDNAIGIVTTGNYESVNRGSESYRASFSVGGLRDTVTGIVPISGEDVTVANSVETRKRFGASVTLDYAFEEGAIWLTNFYSMTTRDPFSITKLYDPKADKLTYTVRDSRTSLNGLSNALNGELRLLGTNMDWSLSSYKIVNNNSYDFSMTLWQVSPFDNAKLSSKDVSTYIAASKDNVPEMLLRDNYDRPNKMVQSDYVGQYNLKVPFNIGDLFAASIKAGGKYSQSNRDNKSDGHGLGQYYLGGSFITVAQQFYNHPLIKTSNGNISALNFTRPLNNSASVVNDKYKLFPLFDRDVQKDWAEQQRPSFQFDRNSLSESYNLKEEVSAGYLMTELKLGNVLTVITGARYEHDDNRYTSVWTSAYEVYGRSGIMKDTTTTRVYENWFPHVHAKILIVDGFDVRLSANKTLSRPDYYWVSPWTRLDPSNATINRGNPLLRATRVGNYNASMYLYSNVAGFFSLSGYYKDLRDIFYRKRSQVFKAEDIIALGIPGKEGGYAMTSYENADRAEVRGIEVEWQTQLAFYSWMPELMKGFVFNVNYSRIWSKTYFPFYKFNATQIPGSRPPKYSYDLTDFKREGPMPGQSDKIINLSLGYDIGKLSTRVSYSYQGPSISAVGEIAESDTWNKEFQRWDSTIKYKFFDWMSLNINLVNITNQPDQAYYGAADFPTSEYYYGMTGSASIDIIF